MYNRYQTAGPKKTTPKKLSIHPDISNSINRVDSIFPGAKDLMSYTAMAESTGGQNPNAGQNYFQIMQEGLDDVKDIKSHPDLTKKLKIVKDKFGLDIANMDLAEVRTNPLANTIVARLYYMNDKNPIPKTQEGMAKYWSKYYNTSLDKHGTPEYFNKAVSQFDYKSASEPKSITIPETIPSVQDNTFIPQAKPRQMGGSMMSNPGMYQRMQQAPSQQELPGGVMQPIPGSDAVEFTGQTHKEGGIMMDPQTEVEDGETMDKVVMKNGKNEDYFFSSYLKKGGQSYANMHKEILSRGGNQEEINYLAAMQEKAAKRSPNKIAKLGGVMQYQKGGKKNKARNKELQKELYRIYIDRGGDLSFKKWNKENPFNEEAAIKSFEEYQNLIKNEDFRGEIESENSGPVETVGLRQDLTGAYGYKEDSGDGYTICQSGNCQDGTGVMYTYHDDGAGNKEVIAMYEGDFKDGVPTGQGKFTWNDPSAAEDQNVEFVASSNFEVGEFTADASGHPTLVKGTQDYGEIGVKTGIFSGDNKKNSLVSGTETSDGVTTNYEDGEETKKFSKDTRNSLETQGLLEAIPFNYSQGEIKSDYSSMKDTKKYKQPTQEELNARGYNSFDEFRADYERYTDESYDWDNTTQWGKMHANAWNTLGKGIDEGFVSTGTYTSPETTLENDEPNFVGMDRIEMRQWHRDNPGYFENCECDPSLAKGSIDCQEACADQNKDKNINNSNNTNNDVNLGRGSSMPLLAYAAGAAQLVPAIYAMTHKQPAPDMVPFESGVTSPIVPGRLRAEKLSHINMNQQRSANDASLREMNQFIDTSGGGPANIVNRMASFSKKHAGDMQIAAAEKQANIGIENQNVAIENQTNLHNLKMEQEAALGNAQMQQSEAQRLNEVNAINTAAKNKVKDDEEYMKYAGIIAGAQGLGSLFGDMLAYKGDQLRARGYGIGGSTERMFLRKHLGKTLKYADGSVFCEECTEEDIANYWQASQPRPRKIKNTEKVNVLNQGN